MFKIVNKLPFKWKLLFGVQGIVTVAIMISRQSMITKHKDREISFDSALQSSTSSSSSSSSSSLTSNKK